MIVQSAITALGAGLQASFAASGGTGPYTYSVLSGGAGGSIDATTGLYTAPTVVNPDPAKAFDTIRAADSAAATATTTILVADPLLLFCEILEREMGLASGRVYLWDQKIAQPTDAGLFIAVGIVTCRPFGNSNVQDGSSSGFQSQQSVNMLATLSIDIISRSSEARTRKEEVLLALASNYAQTQQTLNSFAVGTLPSGGQFTNLSQIDGAAIPYRFNISVNIQYFARKATSVPYFDQIASPIVSEES